MRLFHANGAPIFGVMLEEDNGGGTGGGNNGEGNDGDTGDDDDGDPSGVQDAAKLLETLKKERAARRAAERELKPLKTEAQQRAEREKSATDKASERIAALEAQLAEAETERRTARLTRAIRDADRRLGLALHDPDVVADLLRYGADDFDEAGKPIGVEARLRALVKDKPYLAGAQRPGSADGGSGGSGGNAAHRDMNSMIRQAAGRA